MLSDSGLTPDAAGAEQDELLVEVRSIFRHGVAGAERPGLITQRVAHADVESLGHLLGHHGLVGP